MTQHSCLYEGKVQHRRFQPVEHGFCYSLFLVYVDLDELPGLFVRSWFWSSERRGLASFFREHHLGPSGEPLAECVRDLVQVRLGWRPRGPIRLLTHFRYVGFVMNPVSFYYCFDDTGEELQAVVAEVNNTPWNEQYCYVLDVRKQSKSLMTAELPKDFHVSPFLRMDYDYRWCLNTPGDELLLQIDVCAEDFTAFQATLRLNRVPMTNRHLARALLRYPFMTLRVYLAIHWQAFRLWRKRVPFVPHPGINRRTNSKVLDGNLAQSQADRPNIPRQ